MTYLFEGALLHRDSLGTVQEIRPGAVNWMTAGKGIAHSERSPAVDRAHDSVLHGIQTWIALPDEAEETDPAFCHYPAAEIPHWTENGVEITLVAGMLGDRQSPVQTFSPLLYLDLQLAAGGRFTLPADYRELAAYTVTEGIAIAGSHIEQHRLVMLEPKQAVDITGQTAGRCIVVGGEPVGERHKWWNFVSSRVARIEQAKQDWQSDRFGSVPNETERIPLPNTAPWSSSPSSVASPKPGSEKPHSDTKEAPL